MQLNKLMKEATVFVAVFVPVAMCVLLYFAANKEIVVADVAQDEIVNNRLNSEAEKNSLTDDHHIRIDRDRKNTNCFCIPIPQGIDAESVVIENRYMDRELRVFIQTKDEPGMEDFYENNSVYGVCDNVTDGHFETKDQEISLRFQLNGVYEYKSVLEADTLYIEFMSPKEVYDRIVVIDAAYGGEDDGGTDNDLAGKDVTLAIAKSVKGRMDETDIKVYYTRMDDSNPTDELRVQLASDSKADMLIRIEANRSESSKIYGTECVYNSRFFIPKFGSIELADLLERQVVTAISGKANGLVEATEEDTVVMEATVPAATVRVGYITNKQENRLLSREDYIERIASGIYETIMKAYEADGT